MACIIQITHFLCKVKFEYNQKKFKVTCLKFIRRGFPVYTVFRTGPSVRSLTAGPPENSFRVDKIIHFANLNYRPNVI